jgi:vacuolar-type H+-ATPase subunit F/Vma7
MPSLRTIVGPALANGFRLAGLAVDEVRTPVEASALLDRLASRADIGVILLQQDWFDALPDAQRRALERAPLPIIVPIPPAEWMEHRGAAESYILDLLQRAIGYRVRLQ